MLTVAWCVLTVAGHVWAYHMNEGRDVSGCRPVHRDRLSVLDITHFNTLTDLHGEPKVIYGQFGAPTTREVVHRLTGPLRPAGAARGPPLAAERARRRERQFQLEPCAPRPAVRGAERAARVMHVSSLWKRGLRLPPQPSPHSSHSQPTAAAAAAAAVAAAAAADVACRHRRRNAAAAGTCGAARQPAVEGARAHAVGAAIISVMLSPLRRMRPSCLRVFFLTWSSSASSSTRFMYSSKPMILPSILKSVFS